MRQEEWDPVVDPVLNREFSDRTWDIINGKQEVEEENKDGGEIDEIELVIDGIDGIGGLKLDNEEIAKIAEIGIEVSRVLEKQRIVKEWGKFLSCKKILKKDLKNDNKRNRRKKREARRRSRRSRRRRRKEREARRKREEREVLAEEFLAIQKRMNPELYEWFEEIYQMFMKEEYEKMKIDIYKIYTIYTTIYNEWKLGR